MERMQQGKTLLKCWEYFNCHKTDCPAYMSTDLRCWLQCGTYCHDDGDGSHKEGEWLEKMEVCIECEVFRKYFQDEDAIETFSLIGLQFEKYKKKLFAAIEELEEAKNNLEKKVAEKTHELRNIHTQLIQSAKMASIGQFSAGIAHEINNPLAGILNCIRSLLGDPEIKGQRRGYLELALKGLLRIQHTIGQILSFSGRQEFKLRLADINQLIREAVEFIRYRLAEQKIILRYNLSESLPQILCDPHQLQQVFMNVINNALDAMSLEGNLTISTAVVKNDIEIRFIDNGKGIREEDLDKIFDPFWTTKEVGKGVGLGLSISYSIIQQHHGKIDIKSKENEGTTVTITLPYKDYND